MSNEQEGAFGTQYEDTYPGMLQKLLVIEDRSNYRRYYLGNPDAFEAQDITAFLEKYPLCSVKVDWMIVPLEGGEEVGPFDTTLTPYPSTVTLGDQSFPVGEYRMNPIWPQIKKSVEDGDIVAIDPETGAHATLTNFSKDPNDYPATTADLDARDNFASEVRALHPTQADRIETALREVSARLGDDRIDLAQRIEAVEKKLNLGLDILEYHLGRNVPEVQR
jgi:hypothetical protein